MPVPGRVTIGIPTINRSKLALRAIRSALAQSYGDIEVIVSDDVSTDDTVERVRELGDARVVLFEQKNRLGLVGNFNFCLQHASGEFFLLLGDDDMLLPEAITKLVTPFLQASAFGAADSFGMVWCPCRIADASSSQFWITEAGPKSESPVSMLTALWAGNRGPRLSGILLRTEDSRSIGGYQEKYGDLCDIGNWGLAALLRERVACVPEPLVQYTNHLGSTTSQSSVKKWQDWARLVHADLLAKVRARGDYQGERRLASAKANFISGITLTILIQTIGRPGWLRNAVWQAFRTPGAVFTPYMFRRLLKDGRKVLTVRRSAKQSGR
ncbi:MAG TPA: glycosyltransferase [Acidobacteriaceae bacterium]|nr:glycosyltransferase [Acidobacteriaceae bacterium]